MKLCFRIAWAVMWVQDKHVCKSPLWQTRRVLDVICDADCLLYSMASSYNALWFRSRSGWQFFIQTIGLEYLTTVRSQSEHEAEAGGI